MRISHLYTGDDGQSHFEDLDVPLEETSIGSLSELVPAPGVIFRETRPGWSDEFHCAPRRQFIITLAGLAEIACGDGTTRRFGPGDVLLAEDTTGQGHLTRELEPLRRSLFVPVADDFDAGRWRIAAP